MLDAVEAARYSVRLETYIFADSPLGRKFRETLVRACNRGARVQVLLDAWGSFPLSDQFWTPLREAGGAFRWFNPLTFKRITFRDHRKLLVCDEAVGFVGGLNIAPEYEGDGVSRGWRDLGLRVGGTLAAELAGAFDAMFARADSQHRPFTRLRKASARQAIAGAEGELLLSGPGRGRNAIKRALLADLRETARLQLVAAYFLPTRQLRRALGRVARRGGQAQLILPQKSDVALSRLATRSLYQRFLRAGVEVYEYEPQILHTKLIVTDRACYVGSSNLDARSLHINYELMVRLTDPERLAEARTIFQEHLAHSRRIEPQVWRRSRTFWHKLQERWACFVLARLDPLFTRRQLRWWRP
jgi:cardiolipin synthase